jgi:hypothetical protein
MADNKSSTRSLPQHRVQARKLRKRAIFEAGAVVVFSIGMYVLIHEGLHIALKIICGLMLVSSAANGLGDYFGYKDRVKMIREKEAQSDT